MAASRVKVYCVPSSATTEPSAPSDGAAADGGAEGGGVLLPPCGET
ncbi:hypothetical protein [Streptomyces sp. NRRL B-24484]|nr:hypothetical protein [Streptomyces sp. NRRL B-24484]